MNAQLWKVRAISYRGNTPKMRNTTGRFFLQLMRNFDSGSPIVHPSSPRLDAGLKGQSVIVMFRNGFQAQEQVRTKVLQSFTSAPPDGTVVRIGDTRSSVLSSSGSGRL